MSVMIGRCVTGLLCFFFCPMLTRGTVYIRSGSEISDCNMTCPEDEGVLELYRKCGGVEGTLLELYCEDQHTKNNDKSRLHLHTGSGCWKLTQAERRDSCVYITEFHSDPTRQLSSTEIRVLDPVLISNITSNCSRLGEETAVSVQFSGEESAVTWEVDGEPLSERYRLIDDNRTLIIPGVQRDDAERRFRVRITNPVSEEIREYRLINDTMFIRMLETKGSDSYGRTRGGLIAGLVLVLVVVFCIIGWILRGRSNVIRKDSENGWLAAVTQNGSENIIGDTNAGRDGGDPNAQCPRICHHARISEPPIHCL
ncbi:uncharacterized protein LOC120928722 [Rana temporaria]|uniref:uncharacterized protein LOC120928722 n=1 Tax=Rana temporaria TaxID=8407 RepID=UPI001AAD7169|nr:uncharacterized protein LOC120928722 [Rana temporaria]